MQRLVVHGKSRAPGLGSFALVPLAEAREQALANRRLARAGGGPARGRTARAGVPTFDAAVARVIAVGATRPSPRVALVERLLLCPSDTLPKHRLQSEPG